MLNFLKKIFSPGPAVNYKELVGRGAVIVDVRTPAEYKSGHIKGSLNLPLQSLTQSLGKIKSGVPVITCCASGMRSASAKSILKNNGFEEVYNGGAWSGLNQQLKG